MATKRPAAELPSRVQPCLPTLVSKPPVGDEWQHEVKWDGYRLICFKDGSSVRLQTRNGFDWTERFPGIAQALRSLKAKTAILDGEACILDPRGVSDFGLLQSALASGNKAASAAQLYVFDLLFVDGRDLRQEPYRERRAMLVDLLERSSRHPNLHLSEAIEEDPRRIYEHACKLGLEGIVSKRLDAPYLAGRAKSWVKTKCVQRDDFVVIGYEPAPGGAVNKLRVARRDETGKLRYAGGVGSGLSERISQGLRKRLDKMVVAKPPIPGVKTRAKGIKWTQPAVVVDVEYRGWSRADQKLRHPAFKGMREDKGVDDLAVVRITGGEEQG